MPVAAHENCKPLFIPQRLWEDHKRELGEYNRIRVEEHLVWNNRWRKKIAPSERTTFLRFLGLTNPLKGQLFQIRLDARAIAHAVARELRSV